MEYTIEITKSKNSRIGEVDFNNLQFGKNYSDHMFIAEYIDGKWQNCRIIPFGDLSLSPASSFMHYGQAIFEGMKAYKDEDGHALLFRTEQNHKRWNISAVRMGMPEIPYDLFSASLNELVAIDKAWIPTQDGCSLYLRPFMFAADEFVGIRPTENFIYCVITSPAGRYYSKPVKVLAADKYVRAFPGGTGYAKASGNYGASMLPLKEAISKGYDQVLWMDGFEFRYAEEIGSMNVFFIVDNVVLTPALNGTILDGVTRDSCIQLLRSYGLIVNETKVDLEEILKASKAGKLQDAFGTGTAASVAPISHIEYKGTVMELPAIETREISNRLKKDLEGIKSGRVTDKYGWISKVKSHISALV